MAMAQTQVTGTVVSSDDGQPVVGASVLVVGTKTGTATDVNGNFTLSVPTDSKLEISYIGMVSKKVTVKGKNLKIVLDPDSKTLDEVMVVAYGTQTKSSFTGSAAVMDAKDLNKKITTNVADALVGSVPGLQLTGASGQPGAKQGNIHIRGIASLYANTDPLIIVDGAPYAASLSNLPQEDIKSITVLKDASSAALYGARGAAGVILITTKTGNSETAKINLDAKWGGTSRSVQNYDVFKDPASYMEAYYSQFYNYAFYTKGMSAVDANAWANKHALSDPQTGLQYNPFNVPNGENLIGLDGKINPKATLGRSYKYNGTTYYLQPDNWEDAAYRHGFRQEYNVNVSGGSSKWNYYTSVGYLSEDGILENSSFRRFTARFKADYQANKWLKTYANVGYIRSNTESNPNLSDVSSSSGNMALYTQFIAPIYPLYVRTLDANGNPQIMTDAYGHLKYDFGVPATNYPGQGARPFSATANPLGTNKYDTYKSDGDQIQGQFNFDVSFTSWLKFVSTNSFNLGLTRESQYQNPYIGSAVASNGSLTKDNMTSFRQNYVQTLNFHKQFGGHDLQAMLGHEWYKQHSDYLEADARGGFSPAIKEINAFSDRYDSQSYNTNYNVEGYFGNVLYNYNQTYFGQVSYRRDASSRFAKAHRWGNFWSVGGAWIISNENFFKNLNANWVNQLKIKASIGQQGNDGIPDFQYLERYSLNKGTNSMLPSFYAIGNEDITWETTTNFNVGMEFALFNNRLSGEFNYYNKKTTNMLFWLSIPESMGTRGYYGNLGDIRNTGVELTLNGDIIRTKNIVWNVSANISHNNTKALKLPADKTKQYGGFSAADVLHGFNVSMWYQEGKPLYNAMLPDYAGVNDKGEALYWVDQDVYADYKAGKMSNSSKPGAKHSFTTTNWSEATYYTHSMLPAANGGFSTSLQFYNFDVNAIFDYQIGGKIYDFGYSRLMESIETSATGFNLSKDVLKAWTPNNTSSNIPAFMYGSDNARSQSTRFLTSAKYLNFQSFSVGYTLPKSLTKKLMLSNIRVYVQGENICFWSARKGLDPRYNFQGTTQQGIDSYAPVRTILGGIQLSF